MVFKGVIIVGLTASVVMGMWEMIVELFAGNGFWAAPVYISATLLRDYQQVATPVPFALIPVVLGLMGHMMNSAILGFLFSRVAPRVTQSVGGLVGLGAVYGVIIFVVMWLGVLPLIDPVMLRLSVLGFLAAHMMWGVVLGLGLGRTYDSQYQLRNAHA